MIGRIYRIIHLESDICYVGSTLNELRHRWQLHKTAYQRWREGNHREVSIYPHFELFGIDKFKMILVKEYEVVDKKHLQAYEQLWITKFRKICVNKIGSFRIKKMYYKVYCEENKEKIKVQQAARREKNKDNAKTYNKKYREANKDSLTSQKAEKFECECGGTWTKGHGSARHQRTKKHQSWVENKA